MLVKINSIAYAGIEPIGIDIEVNISQRALPGFEIVGLPDKAISESKERIRTAITNTFSIDKPYKFVINLAPADIPKEGVFYDLPIAVAIASGIKKFELPEDSLFFGELSLSGDTRHTKGALLAALFAKDAGFKNIYLPAKSLNEAGIISGLNLFPVESLSELISHLTGEKSIIPKVKNSSDQSPAIVRSNADFDMNEVIGQESAKRALEICAAGGHNILMVGSPGSGKSMLSRALRGILPPLNEKEALEVTKILSSAGRLGAGESTVYERQYRAPHHTTSAIGMIGGGKFPKPGEVTLAHRGVLFLDEFPEFPRNVLESLRQPLEDGFLTVSRSNGRVNFPARFMLVAASNPCPCGYFGDERKECRCNTFQIERYRKKISGPILDRIDMHISVKAVELEKLSSHEKNSLAGEASELIFNRVIRVRRIQEERFREFGIFCNGEMSNTMVKQFCKLDEQSRNTLSSALMKFGISARGYFKILKIARTIADLESVSRSETTKIANENLSSLSYKHIAEALQYRLGGFAGEE